MYAPLKTIPMKKTYDENPYSLKMQDRQAKPGS